MIFYNGQTGSLGQYLKDYAPQAHALDFRLDPKNSYAQNWSELLGRSTSSEVTLIPLAGMVSVPACEKDPAQAHQINVIETQRLVEAFIEAAKALSKRPRIIYVSTGHIYAECPAPQKITENSPIAPRSVYAKTKLDAERALQMIADEQKVNLDILRVFGLVAPVQPAHYVLQSMIRRVKNRDFAQVPGLGFHRDYLDARDVCRALDRVARSTHPSTSSRIFNVCSGQPVKIQTLIEEIADCLGIKKSEYEAQLSSGEKRADDVSWIVGDPTYFIQTFGAPIQKITLNETIQNAVQNHAKDC